MFFPRLFFLLVVLAFLSVVVGAPLSPAQKQEVLKRVKAAQAKQHGKPLSSAQKNKIEKDVRAIKVAPTKKPTKSASKKAVTAPISYKKGEVTAGAQKSATVKGPGASDTLDKTSGASKAETMKTKGALSGDMSKQGPDPYAHDDGYSNQPYKASGYPEGQNGATYDDALSGGKANSNLRA